MSSFIQRKDSAGLRTYIEETWLNNSMFINYDRVETTDSNTGKVINVEYVIPRDADGLIRREAFRNKWLMELYYSNLDDKNSFANKFSTYMYLGS
jgi:hypothetical protein